MILGAGLVASALLYFTFRKSAEPETPKKLEQTEKAKDPVKAEQKEEKKQETKPVYFFVLG